MGGIHDDDVEPGAGSGESAQGHQHLQVSKLTGEKTTRTRIRALQDEERVEEIARMLGGQKITESTLRHAQEMLQLGTSTGDGKPAGKRKRQVKRSGQG